MEEVDLLARRADEVGVARRVVIGRQELGDHDHEVDRQDDDARDHRQPVLAELPPHQLRLRGEIDALLLGRHRLGGIGLERRGRGRVRQGAPSGGRPGCLPRCRRLAHLVAAPCRRMRGSSMRQRDVGDQHADHRQEGQEHQEGAGEIHVLRSAAPGSAAARWSAATARSRRSRRRRRSRAGCRRYRR